MMTFAEDGNMDIPKGIAINTPRTNLKSTKNKHNELALFIQIRR